MQQIRNKTPPATRQ